MPRLPLGGPLLPATSSLRPGLPEPKTTQATRKKREEQNKMKVCVLLALPDLRCQRGTAWLFDQICGSGSFAGGILFSWRKRPQQSRPLVRRSCRSDLSLCSDLSAACQRLASGLELRSGRLTGDLLEESQRANAVSTSAVGSFAVERHITFVVFARLVLLPLSSDGSLFTVPGEAVVAALKGP